MIRFFWLNYVIIRKNIHKFLNVVLVTDIKCLLPRTVPAAAIQRQIEPDLKVLLLIFVWDSKLSVAQKSSSISGLLFDTFLGHSLFSKQKIKICLKRSQGLHSYLDIKGRVAEQLLLASRRLPGRITNVLGER